MADTGEPAVAVVNETDEPLDTARWAALVRDVLCAEGVVAPAETNVVFVDAAEMAELNEEHMGAHGPTDVLSFPIDDEVGAGSDPTGGSDVRFVGDIVICPEIARSNAADHAGTFEDEIALLLVHGTLHLLGHDHAGADERAEMWTAEQRHLERSWRPLSRDPWVGP